MLTEAQKEQRRNFVGSSDIAAIIGVDERRNAGDIYLRKTGQLADEEANTQMNRGIELEPFVLNLFEVEMGVGLHRDIWVQGDEVCAANLDAAIIKAGAVIPVESLTARIPDAQLQPHIEAPVEAKTSNLGKDWNRETGQIPTLVLVQASFQIYCAGPQCQHAFVPALIPEFQRFKFLTPVPIVKRNNELIEELRVAAHEFMNCVRTGKQPTNAVPHLESLKRMRREPESVISLGDEAAELWAGYAEAGERLKSADADKDELKRQILAMLGTHEAGRLLDGRLITFLEQNSPRRCDVDKLQVLSPTLYEETVSQDKHRVLRMKAAPKVKGAKR